MFVFTPAFIANIGCIYAGLVVPAFNSVKVPLPTCTTVPRRRCLHLGLRWDNDCTFDTCVKCTKLYRDHSVIHRTSVADIGRVRIAPSCLSALTAVEVAFLVELTQRRRNRWREYPCFLALGVHHTLECLACQNLLTGVISRTTIGLVISLHSYLTFNLSTPTFLNLLPMVH